MLSIGHYLKDNGKPLKDFKQKLDLMIFLTLGIENGLKEVGPALRENCQKDTAIVQARDYGSQYKNGSSGDKMKWIVYSQFGLP